MLSLSALLCGSSQSLEGHFSALEDADFSSAGCAQLVRMSQGGGMSQGGSDPTEVHQEGVSHHLMVFQGGELPSIPAVRQITRFPSHRFILQPVVSQTVGGGIVGEDPCGLNSHLLPSLPPLLQAGSLSSGSSYELTQGRDVCGRLSSSSTDGIRQLLPLCSHRLHSLHLSPFSARNNFRGGRFKKWFINVLEMLFCV